MSSVRFIGLDVHAETVEVAAAEPAGEVRSLGVIPNREAERFESYAHAKEVLSTTSRCSITRGAATRRSARSVRPNSNDGPLMRHSQPVHEIGSCPPAGEEVLT